MVHRSVAWFRNVALVSAVVAVAMVPVVTLLIDGALPLWLHIPLIIAALTAMAGGAAVAGVALVEYRARLARPVAKAE